MKIFTLLILNILLGCSTISKNSPSSSIDFNEDKNQFFFSILIENKKAECFWDTGATTSSLAKNMFSHLLPLEGGKVVSTFGNTETQTKVEVANIQLGNINLQKIPFYLREKIKGQKDCVAGLDLFQGTTFMINFVEKKIYLGQFNIAKMYDLIPNKIIILPVTVENEAVTAAFDTGANYTAIDKTIIEKLGHKAIFLEEIPGKDALGNSKPIRLFRLDSINVGHVHFKNILVVEADFSLMRSKKADFPLVFLGAGEISKHKWSFDLKNNKWNVE